MEKVDLVLSAGMIRSASTWLYNVLRLILLSEPTVAGDFSCGWIGDLQKIPLKRHMLVKVHAYNQKLVDQARLVFYSYRDIRDALASNARKFGAKPSINLADNLISQHNKWVHVADFSMKYEEMLKDKKNLVSGIAAMLKIAVSDPEMVCRQIDEMSYESEGEKNDAYHQTNLFHRGHMTDGRYRSWKGVIDKELEKAIVDRHLEWFEKNNYPI